MSHKIMFMGFTVFCIHIIVKLITKQNSEELSNFAKPLTVSEGRFDASYDVIIVTNLKHI